MVHSIVLKSTVYNFESEPPSTSAFLFLFFIKTKIIDLYGYCLFRLRWWSCWMREGRQPRGRSSADGTLKKCARQPRRRPSWMGTETMSCNRDIYIIYTVYCIMYIPCPWQCCGAKPFGQTGSGVFALPGLNSPLAAICNSTTFQIFRRSRKSH